MDNEEKYKLKLKKMKHIKRTTTYLMLAVLWALVIFASCISNKRKTMPQVYEKNDNVSISDTTDVNGNLILRDGNVISKPNRRINTHSSHAAHDSHVSHVSHYSSR
jgi:hypothetical protein